VKSHWTLINEHSGQIEPFPVSDRVDAAELAERMGKTAFQARNLGQALRIWQEMLAQDEVVIFFGLAGAMVPAGMRPLIVFLIENRLIDVLVTTGANMYHDVYEALGYQHWQGSPDGDDVHLARLRVVRFYDVLAPEHEFSLGEKFITDFSLTLDDGRPYNTREYFTLLGKALAPVAKQKGIVAAAAEHGVPIYSPALGDSVYGLAMAEGRLRTGHRVNFDIIGDVLEMAHIALCARATGVVYLGGGTPKNFIQQSGVASYLFGRDKPGHSYGLQITMDEPQWGGLSGCTFEEAQSWRKIAPSARFVTVNVEATVALPLIVSALAEQLAKGEQRGKLPALNWDWSAEATAGTGQSRHGSHLDS